MGKYTDRLYKEFMNYQDWLCASDPKDQDPKHLEREFDDLTQWLNNQ